jgi:hypothetical protein
MDLSIICVLFSPSFFVVLCVVFLLNLGRPSDN